MQGKNKSKGGKSKGLGDTVEAVLSATGVAAIVKFIAGDDCGCDDRKKVLNNMFPYRKTHCLTEDEYNYLAGFYEANKTIVTTQEQNALLLIYNRVFNSDRKFSTCVPCVRQVVKELKKVFDAY